MYTFQLSASIFIATGYHCFVFQDCGTALMAASKSDHTGVDRVVQLLSSNGEPKDEVRHNINNGQQLATWLPKTIFQFLASSE